MTTLTSPHDLLAAIPFLIGYHPTDSLVLVSLKDESVGMAMRVDYPTLIDSKFSPDLTDSLLFHLTREGGDGALVIAYVPEDRNDGPMILETIAASLNEADIEVRESLIVQGGRWRSTLCSDELCCPPGGNELPEIAASRVAAEQVSQGHPMPLLDSHALVDSIAPLALSEDSDFIASVSTSHLSQRDGAISVIDLASRFIAGSIGSNRVADQMLSARVISALRDIQVRDFALGSHDGATIHIYAMMWQYLLRIAPAGYVAPIASLYAALCYENGEGALANRSLDRARVDEPSYSLAALLRKVFSAGWPPESFAAMRKDLHPKVCASIFDSPASS